jgi:hypothetical protein
MQSVARARRLLNVPYEVFRRAAPKAIFLLRAYSAERKATVKLRFDGYDTIRMQGNAAMLSEVQSGWAARNQYRECLENCFAEGLALL